MRFGSIWALLAPISLWLTPLMATPTPYMKGADPSIIQHTDGFYYSVEAGGGGIAIRKAADMDGFATTKRKVIWTDDNKLGDIWAPEIVSEGGKLYIYFTGKKSADHRMYYISSDQPESGWSREKKLNLPDDAWAIDGTLFRYDGQLWFSWSGWGYEENQQGIYICRMKSPTEPTGKRYVISQPKEPWEHASGDKLRVNEGPEAIVDPAGQLHIVYSADVSFKSNYCLGDLRLKKGGDPTKIWDWYKSNGCVFGSQADQMMKGFPTTRWVNGPGHHTFPVKGGDIYGMRTTGVHYPFMYHAVKKGDEYKWGNRLRIGGVWTWWENIKYSRANVPGDNENVGYSPKFGEKGSVT